MAEFSTYRTTTRVPAEPMAPIDDPARWEPEDLTATDDWLYRFTVDDQVEILAAVETVQRSGTAIVNMTREDFPLPNLVEFMARVRQELLEGRGLVCLRGLPVADLGRERAAIAYFGIGCHLGVPISQNAYGHLLGHVRDFGKSFDDPNIRGYRSRAALGFHADHCDYVGLMCMQTAKSGGESRVASAITLYNRMLELRPDLVRELTKDFYWTRHGEVPPGQQPWYTQPIFCFHDGYFSARGASGYIRKAQALPGVPPFTPAQTEAIALFQKTVDQCAADIPFEEGDIQFLHNHVILHSRRAFENWPDRKRHLYRLWLKDDRGGRPVPAAITQSFSGVRVAGYLPKVEIDPEKADEAFA